MKRSILAALLAALCILPLTACSQHAPIFSYDSITVGEDEAAIFEQELLDKIELSRAEEELPEEPSALELSEDVAVQMTSDGDFSYRTYTFSCGDELRIGSHLAPKTGEYIVLDTFELHGEGTVRWYDSAEKVWIEQPLDTGSFDTAMVFFQTEQESAIVYRPYCYKDLENDMMRYEVGLDGTISVSKLGDTYTVWLMSGKTRKLTHTDWTVLLSQSPDLVSDWQTAKDVWKDYIIEGNNRWTYRGYYYLTPTTYIPSGKNYFHRIPDPYIAIKMLSSTDRAAVELSTAMLHVTLELLDEHGFFPTKAGSEWLLTDYGIGASFYDTRFNTDLADALLQAANQTGIETFRSVACAYGEFFLEHARSRHQTVGEGWLVDDYAHPEGNLPTHCSLNHQLKEILFLYRMCDETGDNRFEETADLMLKGVAEIGMNWVKPNCDLWYAVSADGQMIREDYPTLTYNDLYILTQYLDENRPADKLAEERTLLQRLMAKKLYWIIGSGASGYYGENSAEESGIA